MLSKPSHRRFPESNAHAAPARHRTGARLADEGGFSLIELLVTTLIIGILAAIAIPSFLSSESKAFDAQAKELAHTAATTAEAISAENDGNYTKVTAPSLHSSEPAIRITTSPREAYVLSATGSETEYSITTRAANGDEFTVSRSSTGSVSRSCKSAAGKKDCGGAATSSW